jgi:hypothetical protein
VFADYQGKYHAANSKNIVNGRLIAFDEKLKNFQLSLRDVHTTMTPYTSAEAVGVFNAFRLETLMYGASYMLTPLRMEEAPVDMTTKKGKKSQKA